jgi:hypothetical protein
VSTGEKQCRGRAGRLYREPKGRERSGPQSGKATVAEVLGRYGRQDTDYVLIARAGTGERAYTELIGDLAAALRQVDRRVDNQVGTGSRRGEEG